MANYGKYYIAVRLLLLKQYLEANAGRNRIVQRRELEDLLRKHDMPVEKKTLYQDFAALGDVCGLQLEYDVHKKGYRLLNPPFEPYELRLLVDSVQSSKFITREKAREITAKLKRFADKDTVESLNRENHVANRVRSMNDSVVKDADRIHEAIRKDKKIGFRYFHYSPATGNAKNYVKDGQQLIVSPYALLWTGWSASVSLWQCPERVESFIRRRTSQAKRQRCLICMGARLAMFASASAMNLPMPSLTNSARTSRCLRWMPSISPLPPPSKSAPLSLRGLPLLEEG